MKMKSGKSKMLSINAIPLNMAIMVVALILGIAAGCIFTDLADSNALTSFIGGDIRLISQGEVEKYSLLRTFFNFAKYPALSLLLGFTAFGVVLIPGVVFLKGFFLSFSVSSLVSTFGRKGIFTALSMFGLQSLFSIPVLLIISTLVFEFSKPFLYVLSSKTAQIQGKRIKLSSLLVVFSFLLILLFLASVADVLLTPTLVSVSTKTIF